MAISGQGSKIGPHVRDTAFLTGIINSSRVLLRETNFRAEPAPNRLTYLALGTLLLVGIFLALPLWVIDLPPMSDFPSHAASLFIQTHLGSSATLAHYYDVKWSPIPDLASEVIVPLFPGLSAEAGTRLFLAIGVLLWACGPAAVQYALFRRVTVTAIVAAYFAYNRNFTMGLVNFYFAAGFGFFVISAWFASENRSAPERLLFLTALFAITYFMHLLAMLFVGFFLTAFELGKPGNTRPRRLKGAGMICVAAIPELLLSLLYPAGRFGDGNFEIGLIYGLPQRLASLGWTGFAPELVLIGAGTIWAISSGIGRVHESMKLPLIAVLILCFILPVSLFGAWGIHIRFAAMGAALLFASMELHLSPRAKLGLLAASLCVGVIDAATLVWFWNTPARQAAELRTALLKLSPGAKLVVAMDKASIPRNDEFRHVAEYAVLDRGIFDPMVLAEQRQHIVEIRPGWRKLAAATSDQSDNVLLDDLVPLERGARGRPDLLEYFPYLVRWSCNFDDLLLLRLTGEHDDVPPELAPIAEGAIFTLYRVRAPADCARANPH